jgi:hypothetical protein
VPGSFVIATVLTGRPGVLEADGAAGALDADGVTVRWTVTVVGGPTFVFVHPAASGAAAMSAAASARLPIMVGTVTPRIGDSRQRPRPVA